MDRRLRLAVVAVATLFLLGGGVAAADPAGPTNYRSVVTAIDAGDTGAPVSVEILGGDAFIVLRTDGVAVEVPGYDGEPYVQIQPDGTVAVNDRSPARWLNDGRYGTLDVEVPPSADPAAPPAWRVVASDGTYAWHDHRIHYMSPQVPRQVDSSRRETQRVFDWTVPLVVDGTDGTISGTLYWVASTPTAVPLALGVIAAAAGVALARREWLGATPMIVGAGLGALAVSLPMATGLPPGAEGDFVVVALPGLAAALALVSSSIGRAQPRVGAIMRLFAVVPLIVWLVWLGGALYRPIVPGTFPVAVVRAMMGAVTALGIAATIHGVQALRAPKA